MTRRKIRPGGKISAHDRVKIAKFAIDHNISKAVAYAQNQLKVSVGHSTVADWRKKYK